MVEEDVCDLKMYDCGTVYYLPVVLLMLLTRAKKAGH